MTLRRLFMAGSAFLVLAAAPLAHADVRAPLSVAGASKADEAVILAIQEAKADVDSGDMKRARQVLEAVQKRKDFESVKIEFRPVVVLMIAGLAADAEDWPAAERAIVTASEMPSAVAFDWTMRLEVAGQTENVEEAMRSLTVLAERYPTDFDAIGDENLYYWRHKARSLPDSEAKLFALTDATERAGLKPDDPFTDLSRVLSEYVMGLLARDRIAEAQTVAERITDPGERIAMRADKRFDRLGPPGRDRLSPKAGALARLNQVDALIAKHPDLIAGPTARTEALLDLNRAPEALAVIEAALARVAADPKAFKDLDDSLAWAHNVHNNALEAVGRRDEAIEALAVGARVPEDGRPNVSQTLNLGVAQLEGGLPKAALATVATVRLDLMSPYGQSVGLYVKSCAASVLGDRATAQTATKALQALGRDGQKNLFEARLCGADLDGAAALLIDRLKDPQSRGEALLLLQDRPEPPFRSDHDKMLDQRIAALRGRPDILAAVEPIGRIETYHAEDLWPTEP